MGVGKEGGMKRAHSSRSQGSFPHLQSLKNQVPRILAMWPLVHALILTCLTFSPSLPTQESWFHQCPALPATR